MPSISFLGVMFVLNSCLFPFLILFFIRCLLSTFMGRSGGTLIMIIILSDNDIPPNKWRHYFIAIS